MRKTTTLMIESRSLTGGFKHSDLMWKLLVFWETGCLREVIATGGQLYVLAFITLQQQ